MDKTFTPITILLIEDNPMQVGFKSKDLKSRRIDIGSLDDNIDVPGINFTNEGNKGLYGLFSLKILQHPEEIREYISNCLEKEDRAGSAALGSIVGVVPEIIEFDYKLYDNIEINSESDRQDKKHIKYWSSYRKLREHYNPNFLFEKEQHLEKKENENYTVKDFIERINKEPNSTGDESWYKLDETQLQEDDLGLYAGVEITRLFRNHVSIGIPATANKENIKNLHVFSKFYEWMNDYDLGTMFSREERGSKDWDSVITAAVKQLRIRIETQIQAGKAIPSYSQLNALAEGIIPSERVFSFETIYGKRNLPLDGLFIDVIDKSKQNTKIAEWATGLLNKLPVTNAIIKKADKATTKLWETYIEFFEDRIVLSDYSVRLRSLNTTESSYLVEVKKRLGVNSTTGLIANECSIQTLLEKEKGDDKKSVIRLTFLLAITQASIKLEKQKREGNSGAKYFALTDEEYVNILYPKANFKTPFLLSMNIDKDKSGHIEAQTKWLWGNLTIPESKVTAKTLFQISEWILKGEKEILKSFFYEDSDYYPQWLR